MNRSRTFGSAWLHQARLGLRDELRVGLPSIVTRWMLYSLFVTMFYAVWTTVERTSATLPLPRNTLVWYIAITECIIFSSTQMSITIQQQVRDGSFICEILRPIGYATLRIAEVTGRTFGRMVTFVIPALLLPWFLSGTFVSETVETVGVGHGILLLPFLVTSCAMVLGFFDVGIGFAVFWLGSAEPVRWIWQKFLFLFGGLLVPITIYPDWLRRIADLTPFPYLLTYPALGTIHGDGIVIREFLILLCWGAVAVFVAQFLVRRAMKRLEIAGG